MGERKEARRVGVEARAAILERARVGKMAESAHAYVRGATAQFYEWLQTSEAHLNVPEGPAVWICGDCHLGNLGPLADARRRVDVQIRDLDQTVIGNPAHDLIRLGLSLATAARGSDLPGVTTARMIEEMVRGYAMALADADVPDTAEPDAVRLVRRRALGRRWRHLAEERIAGVEPVIPLGKRFWPLSHDEREALTALFADKALRPKLLGLAGVGGEGELTLIDAAYWMKGCSSLGTLRFAAIVDIVGADRPARYAIVDLKEAVAAVAPASPDAAMPPDNADRVVGGACALSPNLGQRMAAVSLLSRSIVARELAPQDLKLEIEQFTRDEAVTAARYLALVVGRAHARQMDAATRVGWRRELERRRPAELDAPSWLWSSVVALAARHEAAYLEHCRLYALTTAA